MNPLSSSQSASFFLQEQPALGYVPTLIGPEALFLKIASKQAGNKIAVFASEILQTSELSQEKQVQLKSIRDDRRISSCTSISELESIVNECYASIFNILNTLPKESLKKLELLYSTERLREGYFNALYVIYFAESYNQINNMNKISFLEICLFGGFLIQTDQIKILFEVIEKIEKQRKELTDEYVDNFLQKISLGLVIKEKYKYVEKIINKIADKNIKEVTEKNIFIENMKDKIPKFANVILQTFSSDLSEENRKILSLIKEDKRILGFIKDNRSLSCIEIREQESIISEHRGKLFCVLKKIPQEQLHHLKISQKEKIKECFLEDIYEHALSYQNIEKSFALTAFSLVFFLLDTQQEETLIEVAKKITDKFKEQSKYLKESSVKLEKEEHILEKEYVEELLEEIFNELSKKDKSELARQVAQMQKELNLSNFQEELSKPNSRKRKREEDEE